MACSSAATSSGSRPVTSIGSDAGQLAHPGELALGVLAGAGLHGLDVAVEQLLEAERLARGGRGAGRVGGAGPPRRRRRRPSRRPARRSARPALAVHHQAGQQRRVAGLLGPQLGRRRRRAAARRPRAARARARAACRRSARWPGGRPARAPASSACSARGALGRSSALRQRSRTPRGGRAEVELGQRGAQVEAGAADDDRAPAGERSPRRSRRGRGGVLARAEGLGDRHEAEQAVLEPRLLGGVRPRR